MLDQKIVFETLAQHGVSFFTGVPDSYLNGFCNYALANMPGRNVIAANEGNAVGIACGHYFATREIPLVYMQNSGMGNVINPLASLAEKDVYAVPMLLLIGWRGQGNTEPNHPQHKLQGEITPGLLDVMHIPYSVLTDDNDDFKAVIEKAISYCKETRQPYGLIAPKGVMAASEKANNVDDAYPMSREEAIEVVLDNMPSDTIYSATTGRATRELFFLRERREETKAHDYLNVGSMGHASMIALRIAVEKPEKKVWCLDGDGASLMHLGALPVIGKRLPSNLVHVIINNGAHETVGGMPVCGGAMNIPALASAAGYPSVFTADSEDTLMSVLKDSLSCSAGPVLIEVRCACGSRADLGRPTTTPVENRDAFMRFLQK